MYTYVKGDNEGSVLVTLCLSLLTWGGEGEAGNRAKPLSGTGWVKGSRYA